MHHFLNLHKYDLNYLFLKVKVGMFSETAHLPYHILGQSNKYSYISTS